MPRTGMRPDQPTWKNGVTGSPKIKIFPLNYLQINVLLNKIECGGTINCALEDLEQIENRIVVFRVPARYYGSMKEANPQFEVQPAQTPVKSPEESRSDRAVKINAAMDRATQCIVSHMRKQILAGKNGL